nr:thiamine pyrophosphate-binding protein [Aestuariivita sp.]
MGTVFALQGEGTNALMDALTASCIDVVLCRHEQGAAFMAKGCVAPDASTHLGAFGVPVSDHVDGAIASAELLVSIGPDPVEYPLEKLTDGPRHGARRRAPCA